MIICVTALPPSLVAVKPPLPPPPLGLNLLTCRWVKTRPIGLLNDGGTHTRLHLLELAPARAQRPTGIAERPGALHPALEQLDRVLVRRYGIVVVLLVGRQVDDLGDERALLSAGAMQDALATH